MRKLRLCRTSKSLGTTGDTIVEVLLAIAIVSLTLGAAYVAANRSIRSTRLSQERGEALKLAEGQVEMLRAYMDHEQDHTPAQGTDKCITSVTTVNNGACTSGPENRYSITTSYINQTFHISVNWDAFGGGENQTLTLYYRHGG